MIIGINGKIGSGKDTVGKIIQAFKEFPLASNESILRILSSGIDNPSTQIKKFADKLKDIVCLLINCTREQLEDAEFKNKELGEEWQITKEYLRSGLGIIKQIQWIDRLDKPVTPRLLLQLLGTECSRNIIHPNIWVNSLMSEYIPYVYHNGDNNWIWKEEKEKIEKYYGTIDNIHIIATYPNWIITDMRFSNELEAVKQRNGITIRVNREPYKWLDANKVHFERTGKYLPKEIEHESETALDNATFDYIIDNNSDIQSLIEKVKEILVKEKLLCQSQ